MERKDIGVLGEELAVKVLKKNKYKILDRNYHSRFGEIDIIAQDKEYICFVEVRLKKRNAVVSPSESINYKKIERIKKTALIYLSERGLSDSFTRFDFVSVVSDYNDKKLIKPEVEVVKDAF